MSEKTKFYSMTKPIRFRRLKMIKMWCSAIRERIKYLFNYSLCKLNILKRYSYRDTVVQVVPLPHLFNPEVVSSKDFGGIVVPRLLVEKYIDMDYFYRDKKGDKKITLSLKNVEESRLFLESHLEDIVVKVEGKGYAIHNLPTFKVNFFNEEDIGPVNTDELLRKVDYKTITLDTSKLSKLTHRSVIGFDIEPDCISKKELKYHYELAVREFKKHLDSINFSDLIIGG